jgi:YesN/AraC family two-component response regulator
MILYIKFMVSMRCKMKVKEELDMLDLPYAIVDLGMVELFSKITIEQRNKLKINLAKSGLELMDDKKSILIEKVKNVIIEMIHYSEEVPKVNFSNYLSERLGYDYVYISNVFSEVKGITIQQYVTYNKIERVKEMLLYNEYSLTEISYKMDYSSVAHLSNQFKKSHRIDAYFLQTNQTKKNNIFREFIKTSFMFGLKHLII